MTVEQTHARVRKARELSETVLRWIEQPTSDAPAGVVADQLVRDLEAIERDLFDEVLASERRQAARKGEALSPHQEKDTSAA